MKCVIHVPCTLTQPLAFLGLNQILVDAYCRHAARTFITITCFALLECTLPPKVLIFFIKTLKTKGFNFLLYHHKCFIELFPIHFNTYVVGLLPLEIFLLLQCRDRL